MNKVTCTSKPDEIDNIGKSNIQGMIFVVTYDDGEEVPCIFVRLGSDEFNLITLKDGNRFTDSENFKNVNSIQDVCEIILELSSTNSLKYYKKSVITITQTE